jgi:cytochrome P450
METAKILMLFTLFLLYYCASIIWRPKLPLPPGPPRLPLIGNLHQYPKDEPWRAYQAWNKKYGPIITLKYGQHTFIVLGNHQVTKDILEKRSGKYSSRPRFIVAERVSKKMGTAILPYNNQWRIHRRLQTSLLNNRICQSYHEIQDIESHQTLHDLLSSNDFSDRFHRFSASLIFTLA